MITPFQRFLNGLSSAQLDMNDMLNELRAFAEVMAKKKTSVELDEDGTFHVMATGTLEEVIHSLHAQLEKLERIKKQKESSN